MVPETLTTSVAASKLTASLAREINGMATAAEPLAEVGSRPDASIDAAPHLPSSEEGSLVGGQAPGRRFGAETCGLQQGKAAVPAAGMHAAWRSKPRQEQWPVPCRRLLVFRIYELGFRV